MAFKKTARLLTKKDYQSVFNAVQQNQGIKITHSFFRVLVCENTLAHPRLGLVITKKAIKKAVDRNRAKRIIREQFRTLTLPIRGDMIVLAYHGCIGAQASEIRKTLQEIWIKLYQQQQKTVSTR